MAKKKDSIWDEQQSIPNETLVKQTKANRVKRFKWLRRGVWLSLIMTPILVIAGMAAYLDSQKEVVEPPAPTALSILSSLGKDAAFTTVEKWLAGSPQPIPGGVILTWNGYKALDKPAVDDERETVAGVFVPTFDREVHYFTVQSANSTLFQVTIEVEVDDVLGSRVTATPAATPLLPEVTTGWENAGEPWFGYQSTGTTENVTSAVETWLAAFVGGNPSTLRNIVGDTDDTHFYLPLSGISVAKATIDRVAYKPSDDVNAPIDNNPETVLVRVKIRILWEGQEQKNTDDYATFTYDLLVIQANTAAPRVVAWGGPGSGSGLTAYSNAIIGVKIDTLPDPTKTDGRTFVPVPETTVEDENPTTPEAPEVPASGEGE